MKATVRMPFYATAPIDPTILNISCRPDLFTKSWVEKHPTNSDIWLLAMEFDVSEIPNNGFTASVTLEELQINKRADSVLVLTLKQPIRVSPRSVRFALRDGRMVANCIVQVNKPKEANTTSQAKKESIFVRATVGGKNLSVKSSHISKGVFRCEISCSVDFFNRLIDARVQAELGDHPAKVDWEIMSGKTTAVFSSPVSISRSQLTDMVGPSSTVSY